MITKSTPAGTKKVIGVVNGDGSTAAYASYPTGSDTISYDPGPKRFGGHNLWKRCTHVSNGSWTLSPPAMLYGESISRPRYRIYGMPGSREGANLPPPSIDLPDMSSCMDDIWNQVDLNCHDSVLLYSGILQAVPLVGGAFKFVKVFNDAAKSLWKGMRKQPFTTVVKSLIQADFIDRFVVSPTIDDARKFLDAHNYVIRVMNTMYERSGLLPSAYQAKRSNSDVQSESDYSITLGYSGSSIEFAGKKKFSQRSDTKLFLLANVAYDTSAVDPIKLWATRVGITRPLDSVWDLVPFSFVIDYFTRAGDFISGIGNELSDQDALQGRIQKVHGCWATTKRQSRIDWTFSDIPYYNLGSWRYRPLETEPNGSASFVRTEFARMTVNPFTLQTEDPSGFFHLGLTSTRARTLAELFIQAKLR